MIFFAYTLYRFLIVKGVYMFIYEIERGDTLYNIAKSYNVSVDDIAKLNNIVKSFFII